MVERVTVDVGGTTLSVAVRRAADAAAPPVVLVHGTGADAGAWDEVAPRLAERRTVHAVDLRGHGTSAWPGTYSVALMAEDLVGLLDHLPEPAVDLVGHSLGGLVALRAAVARPDRVRRLVLEDVGMPHPREPAPPARPGGELGFDWGVVEQVRPEIDSPAADWPATLAAVRAPVLVVAGGPLSFVRAEHVAELVDLVADGRSVTLGTGHEVHRSVPEAFTREVLAFLG